MTTPGIELLKHMRIKFDVLTYPHREIGALPAAHALGLSPTMVVKSLVFRSDTGDYLFALIDGAGRVSEKKLARVSGHKRVGAAAPRDAERITGYQVGGISPLGAKRALPVFLDRRTAEAQELVINAGGRGTMVKLKTVDLVRITGAQIGDIRVP